eukprot:TRINITY_DN15282_c4_g1_i1.p1 TRINITY_DN15282_c4_g1~~TRINITY_DN15282_c4_g1_i1.p1  ORF type:complete len:251 (+),score=67.37 TRINITY_DN15282_c4_g1_i1:50-754(+)
MQIIGLTGGIACGKTTISKMLREDEGVYIVDADTISHKIMEKGSPAAKEVGRVFGHHEGVIGPEGEVNREKLGEIVFADKEQRKKLVNITQGPIFTGMVKEILWAVYVKRFPCVVLDIPLLFETKIFAYICEAVIVTTLPHDLQVQRLVDRNKYTTAHAEQRIAAAMPNAKKEKLADYVIHNNGTLQDTRQQLTDAMISARSKKKLVSPIRVFTLAILLSSGVLASLAYRLLGF